VEGPLHRALRGARRVVSDAARLLPRAARHDSERYLLLRRLNLERRAVDEAVLYKANPGERRDRYTMAIGDIRVLLRRDACLVNATPVCRLYRG
jgi:hypothetical protein